MRCARLAVPLAAVALAACGGDDDGGDGGAATTGTAPQRTTPAGEPGPLPFEQVRGFTLDYMDRQHDDEVGSADPQKVYCPDPEWSGDAAIKRQTAGIHRAKSAEVLVCMQGDPSPSVSYLEYESASEARDAPVTTPTTETATLVEGNIAVTALFAGASELAYIEALKAHCRCGRVIAPAPAR